MNFEIVRQRINDIVKPDSITTSDSDFLATHVKLNKINRLKKFELMPESNVNYTEDQLLNEIIMNPSNKHQFVVVYGQAGSGKSHLIRWFEAKYKNVKPENEVVLFIKRSDNTLKGTIKQLLSIPEVQNIKNKDIYERLTKASMEVPEAELKDIIYSNFWIMVDHDEKNEFGLSNLERKRLSEYLRSKEVQEMLVNEDGPIERIYSKVAENTLVDRNTVAEFKPDDFLNEDYNDILQNSDDLSRPARNVVNKLASEDGNKLAELYANYLNTFVQEVIQRCAGIQAGDFNEIFRDIRKELFNLNKNLTLFIEDITSFTGVDVSLLDALMQVHTGKDEDNICRISSIIGSTSSYVNTHFKDNHKERVTDYIYIPSNPFTKQMLYEFFGRYLNAMSIEDHVFKDWVENGAEDEDYPTYLIDETNKYWEKINLDDNKELSLYPFTKNAIDNFYKYKLGSNNQTPRLIIRDIIEPVMNELLTHKESFPSQQFNIIPVDRGLSLELSKVINDEELLKRESIFLTVWGNGKAEISQKENVNYISEIREEILKEFNLKFINFVNKVELTEHKEDETTEIKNESKSTNTINNHKLDAARVVLQNWEKGEKINISGSTGAQGTLSNALKRLNNYIFNAIDWEAKDVPYDIVERIKDSARFVGLCNTKHTTKCFYELPNTKESSLLIESFCMLILNNSRGWNYDGSELDAYIITSWLSQYENDIVKAVKYYDGANEYNYIDAVISNEIIRQVLCGQYNDSTLKNLNKAIFVEYQTYTGRETGHNNDWKSLITFMKSNDNDKKGLVAIKKYFNIQQGKGGVKQVVLDSRRLDRVLKKVRSNRLQIEDEELQLDDVIKSRKEIFLNYSEIMDRLEKVLTKEKETALAKVDIITSCFDEEDIESDDIIDFCNDIDKLMSDVQKIPLYVPIVETQHVKKNAGKIEIAIKNILKSKDEDNVIDILFCYSNDPILAINRLVTLISDLENCLDKIDFKLKPKEEMFQNNPELDLNYGFNEKISVIEECEKYFEVKE